jgi:pimeloyl-ACP methyl ester carboxylesterase
MATTSAAAEYSSIHIALPGIPGLHVQEWSGSAAMCVLLHGFGEGAYIWNQVAPMLPDKYRRLAIDLRGHGDSEWDPAAEYTTETHVADVIQILEALQLNRFTLVGHSLGGLIAIHIAALMPQKVTALVVVDYGNDISPEARQHSLALFRAGFQKYSSRGAYVAWLTSQRPLLEKSALQFLARHSLRQTSSDSLELKCDPALCDYHCDDVERPEVELKSKLAAITCRTLVIRGAGSAILSDRSAHDMVRQLSRGHLQAVPGAGHAVMIDNPHYFSSLVNTFLAF